MKKRFRLVLRVFSIGVAVLSLVTMRGVNGIHIGDDISELAIENDSTVCDSIDFEAAVRMRAELSGSSHEVAQRGCLT